MPERRPAQLQWHDRRSVDNPGRSAIEGAVLSLPRDGHLAWMAGADWRATFTWQRLDFPPE